MSFWKRWAFWLPAVYAAFLALVFVDMFYAYTGSGESNLGAWLWIFSLLPAGLIQVLISPEAGFPMGSSGIIASGAQFLALVVIGLVIDAMRHRRSMRAARHGGGS